MCGIIAYTGFRDSKEVLLQGLQKMEYRGYDSAGLVIAGKNGFEKIRSVGNVEQLKKKMQGKKTCLSGFGMGHTRWATHGIPSEVNTHPHQAEDMYLVHNGVIENAEELKLLLKGPFVSETDSEVVVHYLLDSYKKNRSLKDAALDTMSRIKGEYVIAAISEKHPGELLAFKKGPSLIVGFGQNEVFVASDIQAFLNYTNKAVFLKDGEMVHVQGPDQVCFYSGNNTIKKQIEHLNQDSKQEGIGKNFPSYMLKEIYEQPECIRHLIDVHLNKKKSSIDLELRGKSHILDNIVKSKHLKIAACGSSYYAALYGKYVIETLARISVEVDMASEFRYRNPVFSQPSPIMLISQSGETADTLAVLKMAQEVSCEVLSICNVLGSSLDRGSHSQVDMLAGIEKSVASTKAFSSTLVIMLLLALDLAKKNKQLKSNEEKQWVQYLLQLPSQLEEILFKKEVFISAANYLKSLKGFIYLARNVYFPLALEGALKMKELTYMLAEAYPAGEMKHGPLALIDERMGVVGLVPETLMRKKTLINLKETRSRKGKLILIASEKDEMAKEMADLFIPLPVSGKEYLNSILFVIPLQLMAYHRACSLGYNVDRPRNLAKSVTVE